ncbi:MAG: hypothetical protein RRB22_05110 [Gammaproteobacteria bacterium]|nr:hypothetical protein [Gammaproteobacteria bacterium]
MLKNFCDAVVASGRGGKIPAALWKGGWTTAVALLLVACASTTSLDQATDASGVPLWVNQGSNILTSKQGRRFHGVGSAPDLGDFSLQTATADTRARQEIARIMASYIEIVSRDFIATGDAAEVGFTAQKAARQMEHVSSIDLTGIEVVGHWRDKDSRTIYSIAAVDMQQVREVINKAAELDPELRDFIHREGDRIFDRISTAED